MGQNGSIHVAKGAQLTLGSEDGNCLNICSVSEASNDVPGMLYVEGTCKMYPGVTLAGREGNNYFGGGVFVSGGSSFVMNGGLIANNRATNMGGGVAVVASYEEISGGFGNLKSSAEILGGRVEQNSAKQGAGVFASAYYYAFADAICAPSPTVGQSQKQGLYLKNVQITDNKADGTDGFGGVYAVMLKAPAAVQIEDTSITGNEAAQGGGIAVTNIPDEKTTITNTVLCNNLADRAGADVYLSKASLELPSASGMDSLYLGEPEDVRGNKIDGWYVDNESPRYMDQAKDAREEYTGYADISADSGDVCLIAAVKSPQAKITFTNEDGSIMKESWYPLGTAAKDIELPEAFKASDETYDYIFEAWGPAIEDVTQNAVYTAKFRRVFKKIKVHYTFHGTSSGRELPAEVLALLPGDTTGYPRDARIEAIAPAKTEVRVEGGKWIFKGFDKDYVLARMENVDDAGAVKFSGYWEFVAKEEPIIPPPDRR